jgi:hypothetical protein
MRPLRDRRAAPVRHERTSCVPAEIISYHSSRPAPATRSRVALHAAAPVLWRWWCPCGRVGWSRCWARQGRIPGNWAGRGWTGRGWTPRCWARWAWARGGLASVRRGRWCRVRRSLCWFRRRGIHRWLRASPARSALLGQRLRLLLGHDGVAITAEPERGGRDQGQEAAGAAADREACADVVAGQLAGRQAERAADQASGHRRVVHGEVAPRGRWQRGGQRDGNDRCGQGALGALGTRRGGRVRGCHGHPWYPEVVALRGLRGGPMSATDMSYHGRAGPRAVRPRPWQSNRLCANRAHSSG